MRRITYLAALVLLGVAAPGLRAQLTKPLDEAAMAQFKWRSIGPANMMGRVTDVEGLPGPSTTFYVAASAGGVWKTTNNGTSFQLVWDGPGVVSMGDVAIAPSDSNQVWLGTGEEDSRNSISPGGGIFKSTDGGKTWTFKGLKETQAIGRIRVHLTNPDIVYVAALGHIWDANPERGLYRTKDGGDHWELVKKISDKAGFVDVILDPRNPDVIWAASWERVRGPYFLNSGGPGSGLWKSTDGGDSWVEVKGKGFPTANKGRIGLAIAPSNPDVMYAEVEAEQEPDGSGGTGLYRSTDSGATWTKMNDVDTRPFYYSQVRVDSENADRVYFSSTPMQFSDDGGKTYGATTNDVHVDDHALWIDPTDGARMVVGNDGGVAISYDRGGNWSYLNNIAIGQFYDVSYNYDMPYRVCGGLQDNGTWCAPSRVSQGGIDNYRWATIGGGDGFYSAQDPVDPTIAWVESQGGNAGRVNTVTGERTSLEKPDWRDHWLPYQDSIVELQQQGVGESDPRIQDLRKQASADSAAYDLRYNWNTPFFQSVHDRSWLYLAGNRVLKSTNWGEYLHPISPDLSYADPEKVDISLNTTGGITVDATGAENYATVVALDESPRHAGWLYAGTDDGRVWMTKDDGDNWTELTGRFPGVPKGTYVSRIEASSFADGRFYVTFDNHRTNDFTPYVYVTEDDGQTFKSISNNLPQGGPNFVHVLEEDPHNPNLLFVGTDVGAYVSTNRGASWQPFQNGLPTVPVHDLEVHPRDHDLIAATHGRSIWIVDITPLEQMSDKVMAQNAALFAPRPAFEFGSEPRGGESSTQQYFSRPTPGSEAEISYWVSDATAKTLADAQADGDGMQGGRMRAGPPADGRSGGRGGQEAPTRGMQQRGPQVEITITAPDGSEFRKLNGPASAGLHKVTWDFRGEEGPEPSPSPYEKVEQERIAARAKVVADSLKQAGWDAQTVDRLARMVTGRTSRREAFAMFEGRRGGGDPEAFQPRPGETPPGRSERGFDYSKMREFRSLVGGSGGMRSMFRRFGAAGAPVAEAGTYKVTLEVGDQTWSQNLKVERQAGYTGNSSPFEADRGELLEMPGISR